MEHPCRIEDLIMSLMASMSRICHMLLGEHSLSLGPLVNAYHTLLKWIEHTGLSRPILSS